MPGWNLADLLEEIARSAPKAPAQVELRANNERRFDWLQLDRRANGVAATLLAFGLGRQDKVAQYLYNSPEYMESVLARRRRPDSRPGL